MVAAERQALARGRSGPAFTPASVTVRIPFMLDFDGRGGYVAGRGRAGWTVVSVPEAEVVDFLSRLPREAWTPGTHRLAAAVGVAS